MKTMHHYEACLPSGASPTVWKKISLDNGLLLELDDFAGMHVAYVEGVHVWSVGRNDMDFSQYFESAMVQRFQGEEGKKKALHRIAERRRRVAEAKDMIAQEMMELDAILDKHSASWTRQ